MTRRKITSPKGVLRTPGADPQRVQHARHYPSADLEAFVEHFWSVRWDFRGLPPHRVETLPHPSVHLIFEHDAGGTIAGVARGRFTRLLEEEGGVFATKFRPGGFRPFVHAPVASFMDSTASVGDVWGADGDALATAVLGETEDDRRVSIVEEFLRRRGPASDENIALVGTIVAAVARDRAILAIGDITSRFALDKRRLQRLFAEYVGVNPKWVIQRYRLHEAAERLALAEPPGQSALALELGYSDQAHFARDFKAIVGVSPGEYAKRCG